MMAAARMPLRKSVQAVVAAFLRAQADAVVFAYRRHVDAVFDDLGVIEDLSPRAFAGDLCSLTVKAALHVFELKGPGGHVHGQQNEAALNAVFGQTGADDGCHLNF